MLKLLPPFLPILADMIPSFCGWQKSKQPENTFKIFLPGVFLMEGGVHLLPVYQPGESVLFVSVN